MSQVLLTSEERERALRHLGYTERESNFLCLAGLHSGYFLRRQYDQFLGRQDGGAATQLIEKSLAKGHVRAFTYRPRTNIYHLCARPFYDALGQEDNRNRRRRQPLTVKNKLMALDFVLANPLREYLATEQEKLAYFNRELQIPNSALPTKLYHSARSVAVTARYFVEKHPIFLTSQAASVSPPVVSFCFVDEGLTTLSRFETFLGHYSRLFASLSQFRVIYVASTPAHFDEAGRTFERLMHAPNGPNGRVPDPDIRRMLDYFEARRRYENGQLEGFDRDKLLQLRSDQETFSGVKNERLYERWKLEGDHEIVKTVASESVPRSVFRGAFSTHLLEHNYDLFGNLTAF